MTELVRDADTVAMKNRFEARRDGPDENPYGNVEPSGYVYDNEKKRIVAMCDDMEDARLIAGLLNAQIDGSPTERTDVD